MSIKPLHDYVMIRLKEETHLSAGGIVIPDSAAEKSNKGEVYAVGKGRTTKDGRLLPPTIKPGDRVLFDKYSGTSVMVGGEELLVMRETDVVAVIEE